MRTASSAFGITIVFLAGIVSAQEFPPETGQADADAGRALPETRQIAVDQLLLASPALRSIAVKRDLDRNHDQYLSDDEIETALRNAEQSAANASRTRYMTNHRQGSWIYNSPPLVVGQNADLYTYRWRGGGYYEFNNPYVYFDPYVTIVATAPRAPPLAQSATSRRVAELSVAERELLAFGGYELSLVDEEFHRLFASLPGEQRSALLAADADGNNDGMVSVQEFFDYNDRRFSRRPRFEADFGEAAYLEVLRLFDALR